MKRCILIGLAILIMIVTIAATSTYTKITFPNKIPAMVVKQPKDKYTWVSPDPDVFTEFAQPKIKFGTRAYLAHSYGTGKYLYDLSIGDKILIDDKEYIVTHIMKYQSKIPSSPYSPQIDLITGKTYSIKELFVKIFGNNKQVVFQTCINAFDNPNWGRMFVIVEESTEGNEVNEIWL